MADPWGLAIALILAMPPLADSTMPPDQPSLGAEGDAIALPAPSRVITSPGEEFFLTLRFQPEQRRSQAILYKVAGDRCQPTWQTELPHEYGPRFALVSDQGFVALVDEWINVRSPYALTILNPRGNPIADYAYEDLQAEIGLSDAEILDQTQAGWWISDLPNLSEDGSALTVGIGGEHLRVDFSTGAIAVRD